MKLLKIPKADAGEFAFRYSSSTDGSINSRHFYPEKFFNDLLCLERRRTERTKKPMCLMLFGIEKISAYDRSGRTGEVIAENLSSAIRETDICGWLEEGKVIGAVFTALDGGEVHSAVESIMKKIKTNLSLILSVELIKSIDVSFHIFPEEYDQNRPDNFINSIFYPEVAAAERSRRIEDLIKRAIDIAGSISAIVIFSPLFAVIALLIKLTSKGPVLFRQERLGKSGERFTFLKFRSMYVNCDDRLHREYIEKLMVGKSYGRQEEESGSPIFKIFNDPRVTKIGRFLRKSSLDELPQFFNVLTGDMSLVGPRPPIPYEVKNYDAWHRRRLLSARPGITGIWQVWGRSRTTFDGMVRMDLRYIRERSLWLDISILLQTPLAVLRCRGAY